METIYFGGTDLSNYGVFVDKSLSFARPAKRVNKVSIPGRNGDLIYADGSFDNVDIEVPCFIRSNFVENFGNLMNYLNSFGSEYKKLSFSSYMEEYRMASFHMAIQPDTGAWLHSGRFSLVFDCKPQRFLQTGDISITMTSSGVLRNPTLMTAKPVMTVWGNGNVTVNGTIVTIAQSADYLTIDSDIMDCYRGSVQMNEKVSFSGNDFPVLGTGNNTITLGTGITKVVITPHWWRL